jgi:hypothetical protein
MGEIKKDDVGRVERFWPAPFLGMQLAVHSEKTSPGNGGEACLKEKRWQGLDATNEPVSLHQRKLENSSEKRWSMFEKASTGPDLRNKPLLLVFRKHGARVCN